MTCSIDFLTTCFLQRICLKQQLWLISVRISINQHLGLYWMELYFGQAFLVFSQRHIPKGDSPSDNFPSGYFPSGNFPKVRLGLLRRPRLTRGLSTVARMGQGAERQSEQILKWAKLAVGRRQFMSQVCYNNFAGPLQSFCTQ